MALVGGRRLDRLDVALAEQEELVAVEVELEPGLGEEQDPVAVLTDRTSGPTSATSLQISRLGARCGRRGDQQSAPRRPFSVVGVPDDDAVGGQADVAVGGGSCGGGATSSWRSASARGAIVAGGTA